MNNPDQWIILWKLSLAIGMMLTTKKLRTQGKSFLYHAVYPLVSERNVGHFLIKIRSLSFLSEKCLTLQGGEKCRWSKLFSASPITFPSLNALCILTLSNWLNEIQNRTSFCEHAEVRLSVQMFCNHHWEKNDSHSCTHIKQQWLQRMVQSASSFLGDGKKV